MAKLIFQNTGEEKELAEGAPLYDACEEVGIPFACNEGVCGTCIIEVVEGGENLSEPTREEKDFLGETDRERLACQCKLKRGCVKIKY